jgi:hypothetical protein
VYYLEKIKSGCSAIHFYLIKTRRKIKVGTIPNKQGISPSVFLELKAAKIPECCHVKLENLVLKELQKENCYESAKTK